MFSKLKQIKDLRSQAKEMQSALSTETVTSEKDGCKVVMDGNMKVMELKISSSLDNSKSADILKDLVNESLKKTQKIMAKKMQEMGGFPGLS